jgi:hypothetical protein
MPPRRSRLGTLRDEVDRIPDGLDLLHVLLLHLHAVLLLDDLGELD